MTSLQTHWLPILNSVVLVLLLTSFVAALVVCVGALNSSYSMMSPSLDW